MRTFSTLAGRGEHGGRRTGRRPGFAFAPGLDALGERVLPTAGLTAPFPLPASAQFGESFDFVDKQFIRATLDASGNLTVKGTDFNDTITVRQIGGKISVDGVKIDFGGGKLASVSAASVNLISVDGGKGHDTLSLASHLVAGQQAISNHILTFIDGGLGSDTIHGSDKADLITDDPSAVGAGDDVIYGYGGLDTVNMLGGNNWADGGEGNDCLHDGDGHSTLNGGLGNDLLTGGGGNDAIWGHQGDDDLQGGAGDDTLVGGSGVDLLDGGSGTNVLTQ